MAIDTAALLARLSEAPGPSGHESAVTEVARESFAPYVDAIGVDALGNLVATRRGTAGDGAPSVLLAAHQDEIGLMVTTIEDGGFLRFTTIGGWDVRVLLAQPVVVHGSQRLIGVVGSRPPHVLGDAARKSAVPLDELFVDVGLPEADVRARVRPGDAITLRRSLVRLNGDRHAGKALDNRASVAAVAVALDALAARRHAWDVHAVATVQEEVGLKGAATAAWGVAPTIAIALDVTFARQPGATDIPYKLGGGPVLGFGPNIHPEVHRSLVAAADALEMTYHVEPIAGASGTDAWAIQVARSGVPTGLVGVPLRYMHSTVEMVSIKDVERAGRLIAETICRLEPDFARGLVEPPSAWDDAAGTTDDAAGTAGRAAGTAVDVAGTARSDVDGA